MIRVQNDGLGKILHWQLYCRLLNFAKKYTPELPAEAVIEGWLNRLYLNDSSLHLLINDVTKDLKITEHAVVEVQEAYGNRIVICHQCLHDTPSLAAIDEGMEYIEQLAAAVNACSIIFFTTEHSKAFMKRYNFHTARTMMVKHGKDIV